MQAAVLADLPLDICLPLVLLVIVYFMAGLRYTAGAFFANLFSVYLVMLVRPLNCCLLVLLPGVCSRSCLI